jgi:pyridoxal phosphate enzyme (YggS family)
VVPFVYLIHSLDSFKLALKINQEAFRIGKKIKCLLQVNTSNEFQKSGCDVHDVIRLVKEISMMENIRLSGLMTIAKMLPDDPLDNDLDEVRNNFRTLKELYDEILYMNIPNVEFHYLSMGMSSDYDLAIQEGSNMLRIGTTIFGDRNQ